MLDLIGKGLKHRGIKFLRLDGTMPRSARENVINSFQGKGPMILIASLRVASLGLNLTRGSNVFFSDPWWCPAVEDQAIDRVYRLGQTREVNVFRFVVEGSIEEKVVELQDRKRQLVKDCFGGDVAKVRESRVRDLRMLLGIE